MHFLANSDFLIKIIKCKKITILSYRDGITTKGIEDQNEHDIFDETKDFIEDYVDNDTIGDDDKGK